MEISFEWGTTKISIGTFIILNIYASIAFDQVNRHKLLTKLE